MKHYMDTDLKRINYLTSEIDAAYHEAAWKLGISDSAMQILYAICNYGDECPLNDIIRLSGVRKQTINSALRKLEKENIVYLETICGRKKKVCLTDQGRLLAKNTVLRVIAIENEIFASWTESERRLYVELTQKYLSSLKEKIQQF